MPPKTFTFEFHEERTKVEVDYTKYDITFIRLTGQNWVIIMMPLSTISGEYLQKLEAADKDMASDLCAVEGGVLTMVMAPEAVKYQALALASRVEHLFNESEEPPLTRINKISKVKNNS